jgi:DNA-binding NarL/FixJ family response regulator
MQHDNGFESLTALPQRSAEADILAAALDQLAVGVMVLDATGTILHANREARAIADEMEGFGVRDNQWVASQAKAAQALFHVMCEIRAQRRCTLPYTANGEMLRAAIVPLVIDHGHPCATVIFPKQAITTTLAINSFSRDYALTFTEQSVLTLLCEGHRVNDVSEQMGCAASTVRTHVRNMLEKTNTHGMRDLVQMVAMQPPASSAIRESARRPSRVATVPHTQRVRATPTDALLAA